MVLRRWRLALLLHALHRRPLVGGPAYGALGGNPWTARKVGASFAIIASRLT